MRNILFRLMMVGIALVITVGTVFAAEPKAAAKPAGIVKATSNDGKSAPKKEPVDINTATDAQLKAIPGLGDAYIAKIVVGRPYANKAQLKSRKVIPDAVYEKIKDLIIAKQPKK